MGRERGGSDDHSTLARVTERSIHRSGQAVSPLKLEDENTSKL